MNCTQTLDEFVSEDPCEQLTPPDLDGNCELTRRIDALTYRQIRDLNIVHDMDRVVLHGRTKSYYVKQLATHAVLDLMPGVAIENSICVIR